MAADSEAVAPEATRHRSDGLTEAIAELGARSLHRRRTIGLLLVAAVLVLAVLASIAVGANPLSPAEVAAGLWHRDDSEAGYIVWSLRGPRTLVGLMVGVALGVAGALIQALTRNPLADPGILGVNAGAGFAVTVGVGVFGAVGVSQYMWWALAGAACATVLVYVIGAAARSATPATLVLAGVALGAVLGGFASALTLLDPITFERLRRWGLGSIARTDLADALSVLPLFAVGTVLALGLARHLNSVALGDDLATALGSNVVRTRVLGIVAVSMLAGGETALTGGIGFVGLMVPHVVRWFTGPDQRWVLSCSALVAPIVVLVADVLGRVIARPSEIEVGVVTAVIGAPVLIALVRRRTASGL